MGRISKKLKTNFKTWGSQFRKEMAKAKKSFYIPKNVHDVQPLMDEGYDPLHAVYIAVQNNLDVQDEGQRLYELLKYGSWTHHWNEFVFLAYHHHQYDAIFLTGIPDVKGSLPHAKRGRK